jgi:hypothetical protein
VMESFPKVVDRVYQACLGRLPQNRQSLLGRDWTAQVAVVECPLDRRKDQADFQWMLTTLTQPLLLGGAGFRCPPGWPFPPE